MTRGSMGSFLSVSFILVEGFHASVEKKSHFQCKCLRLCVYGQGLDQKYGLACLLTLAIE